MASRLLPTFPQDDQSFDDRVLKLQKNIYEGDKGRLRLLILQRDLSSILSVDKKLSVLDAGCGLGLMSEWAATLGHSVCACDCSKLMCEQTEKRLADYPEASVCLSSVQALKPKRGYEVIFCHAVLEWVQDQPAFIEKLSRLLSPDGYLSIMFYNAWAREMAQLVYGNLDYIDKNYQVRQRVKLNPHWPTDPETVETQLERHNLSVISRSGIRVFYDIIREQQHYQQLAEDIIRHELRISQKHPFWQMGRYIHYIAKKSS